MSNPSNLYAEKVFAEHPIALWTLDDAADYVSKITESDRNMTTGWTVSGGATPTQFDNTMFPYPYFSESFTSSIVSSNNTSITLTGPECIAGSSEYGTVTIAFYIYTFGKITSIDIGSKESESPVVKNIVLTDRNQKWTYVSATFDRINSKPYIKIYHNNSAPTEFLINGLTVGLLSEEFSATSLGKTTQPLPVSIEGVYAMARAIEAPVYGLQNNPGYYLGISDYILARDSGMPMVFGSSNSTVLYPNAVDASLIVPGMGFLNDYGRFQDLSLEFWINISPYRKYNTQPSRIVGPTASKDGLYVDGPFLEIRVGSKSASHFIGQWGRPMLITMQSTPNKLALFVNGEEVAVVTYTDDVSLPLFTNPESAKEQDWIGFYVASAADRYEIDCVAIYPYKIPKDVMTRRFVYGQGVQFPENLNISNGGKTTSIDYSVANYSNNYRYPMIGKWEQASIKDNISIFANALTTPTPILPELLVSESTTEEEYMLAMIQHQSSLDPDEPKVFTTKSYIPDTDISIKSCIRFGQMNNIISEYLAGFYGVFGGVEGTPSTNQVLFRVVNSKTSEFLDVYITFDELESKFYLNYKFSYDDMPFSSTELLNGGRFVAGIDVENFTPTNFFSNQSDLVVYVGGTPDFDVNTSAFIYKVGFMSSRNKNLNPDMFTDGVITGSSENQDASALVVGEDSVATYTLVPRIVNDKFLLDIDSNSHWQDYVSLSVLAKTVKNSSGSSVYGLDFIQFNIDYPEQNKTYNGNYVFGYGLLNETVKTYISIQPISAGATASISGKTIVPLSESREVSVAASNYATKVYEVMNGTVIKIDQTLDINSLAIVIHTDINLVGANRRNVFIKRIELASKALDAIDTNYIPTKFGQKILAYKETTENESTSYDYKNITPYIIEKLPAEYLYLTKQTGIRLTKDESDTGLMVLVNESGATGQNIASLQMDLMYNFDAFPETETKIFEIHSSAFVMSFFIKAIDSGKTRAIIYSDTNSTSKTVPTYFWNGRRVYEPILTVKEWSVLGISFNPVIDFSDEIGRIKIVHPISINNVNHYKATDLEQQQTVTSRIWNEVQSDIWSVITNTSNYRDWRAVSVKDEKEKVMGISPEDSFKVFSGTNKIIIDDVDGLVDVGIQDYEYVAFMDVSSQTNQLKAT